MNRNNNSHLISVVIPAYNHERYIEEAVRSVLDQTYKNIEIIIVDDGSTDNTGSICNDFAVEYKGIRFLRQSNMGAHNAINRGIQEASAPFIAILNSDDRFMNYKLERCLEIVQNNPSVELICGNISLIDSKGSILESGIAFDWLKRAYDFFETTKLFPLSILNENFVATTSNMFFTKRLWEKTGGFQPLRYCHDLDFLMANNRSGESYFDSEFIHIHYRVHPQNTINEEISKIRLEIAAVIAVSLVIDNMSLVNDFRNVDYFRNVLKNKNLSNLIILLMMYYLKIGNRNLFYNFISQNEIKELLLRMQD